MDITLFGIFLTLALALITLGLFRSEHTELSLVGFVFLFLLSGVVLSNSITQVIGTNTSSNFTYTADYFADDSNVTLLTSSYEEVTNINGTIPLGGTISHTVGYWLAIASVVGFVGVLLSLRKSEGFK